MQSPLFHIILLTGGNDKFYDEYENENEYYDIYEDDQVCKTISGSHKNQECQFPFTFRGAVYDTCITGSKRRQPWCATELDNSGTYITGKWGYCDTSKCPLGNLKFKNLISCIIIYINCCRTITLFCFIDHCISIQ